MDSQMDPKLLRTISTTKRLLGKHISKPVLADKYLGRPPFRFLLEIVNSVIQHTGFMKDIFTPKELKYDEISSPEHKRLILKKVIEAIENASGEKCAARTSKILSGKEPDKTNEMLQLLAKAISNYSSKPKEKQVEPAAPIPDKLSSGDVVAAEVAENEGQNGEGEANTASNTQAEKKVDTAVKKMSSKKSLPTNNKKSSSNSATIASNAKGRSSVAKSSSSSTTTRPSSTIAKSSSSAGKVISKEAVKSKTGSPSPSSATLVPPKKTSSTNLIKSVSRQSLVKPSASCSKVAVTPEPLKAIGKEEDVGSGQGREQSDEVLPGSQLESSVNSTTPEPAMPPETSADVPTERPVTRTKYRQKNTDGEGGGGGDPENLGENDATCDTEVGASTEIQSKENEDNNEASVSPQDTVGQVNQRGETRESGCSTSSEDVITEHMNQKISEWRANSAERVVHVQVEQEQIEGGPTKTGWINEPEELPGVGSTNLSLNRVFESEEDCGKEKEKNEEVVPPPKLPLKVTPVVRDEPPVMRPVTVLRDNESEDEDDETFLVQEKIECERDLNLERFQYGAVLMNAGGMSMTPSSSTTCIDMTYLPPEQRGLLVNQILETQRELEKLSLSGGSSDIHQSSMIENELAERDKAAVREVYLKQIEDLKEAIQKMSKCANPLANIVQRSQDDACLMEIEFRKFKQENERLQTKIDEAKGETSRTLHPLTEELAQLDGRIEKVEGAIILAKQRLSLIDSEYSTEFIAQIANTPTEDESFAGGPLGSDPIWQFRTFGGDDDDDDADKEDSGIKNKSLMDVFRRAVNMHEGSEEGLVLGNGRSDRKYGPVTGSPSSQTNLLGTPPPPLPKSERRLLNRTVYGDNSPLGRRSLRALRQLEQQVEPPIDKENKPSWWD